MTQGQLDFINLIKSAVNQEKTVFPHRIDWDEVYILSRKHSVIPILYSAIRLNSLEAPNDFMNSLKGEYYSIICRHTNQQYWAQQVFAELENNHVKYMPLKGIVIYNIYPMEEMRTSCDIDIFFDKKRLETIKEIAKKYNLIFVEKGENHYVYCKDNVLFEFHYALTPPNEFLKKYYRNIWNKLINKNGFRFDFSPEDHYIYLLLHFVKHFLNGGGGIRALLDIYLYDKRYELNREYIKKELQKLGLCKFHAVIQKTANVLFGNIEGDEETDRIAGFIVSCSTYGSAKIAVSTKYHSSSKYTSKISYLQYRVFPPMEKMKNMYSILSKVPLLLPFFWVVRWFDVLFTRRERIKTVFETSQQISVEHSLYEILKSVDLDKTISRYY